MYRFSYFKYCEWAAERGKTLTGWFENCDGQEIVDDFLIDPKDENNSYYLREHLRNHWCFTSYPKSPQATPIQKNLENIEKLWNIIDGPYKLY